MKNRTNHYKKVSQITTTIFLALLINSCKFDTIVNVDLPKHKPVIVVNSFFNPDSAWKVKLTRSQGALENGPIQNIADANVDVWEDNQRVVELTHIGNGLYRAENSKPLPGKKYELRASAPDYLPVTASDIAPQAVAITKVKVDTITKADYEELELTISFTDPPAPGSKYHINLWGWSGNENGGLEFNAVNFSSSDLLLSEGQAMDMEFWDNQAVFNDVILAGKQYGLKLRISTYYAQQDLYVMLSTVSDAYYTYHKSFQKHQDTEENPFSEPVIVYNNVENGLGIFAGYSLYKYKLFN